jgi:hypothetical protein
MNDRKHITDEVQRKIDAIRAMDPADPDVSADHGPCRLNPGEDAKLRRAKEEKVAQSLLLKRSASAPEDPGVVG